MILSIGEILIDEIKSYNNGKESIELHCGGAPFNVIFNALKVNNNVGFVGAVGNDENGKFLTNFVSQFSFSYLNIQQINKPTTIALVSNDENGERYFRFIRQDSADYQIEFESIDKELLSKASIIHLGSLMLSKEKGRILADKIVKYALDNHKLLSFDVNFRLDIFKDENEAKTIYQKYIDAADILKLSEDELYLFTNKDNIEDGIQRIIKPNKLITLTLGSKGSYYQYNDSFAYVNSIKVKPIDTTGAGDAFYGTFLGLIDKGIDFNDKESMIKVLEESNKQGALTTLFKGAIK